MNWNKVYDKLPDIEQPVVVRTSGGKCDVCHLSIEEDRLVWYNDMRPQHTNGGVLEWCYIPTDEDDDLPF